jgi:hypothetical protein
MNLQVRSTLYYVLVRYYITCGIYDETGAETLQRLTDFARSKPIVTEKLGVNFVEGVAHSSLNDSLGIDIHHRRQNLRHSQNRWFRSRIGLCKASGRSSEGQ